jgi:putative hydrolase of the HAD superfamily
MASGGPIEFVLFDLGGVLIDPGGVGPMRELSGLGSEEEVWARWLDCRWVRSFEGGRCTPEEFAAGVVADWELGLEPAAFLEEFARWPGLPFPGATELVSEVQAHLPVGCLSNTNALQWDANYRSTPLTDAFAYRFLSFELGLVKPDREIFDVVADALPFLRARVLFLDDNAVNIEAAGAAGFAAEHVRGVDGARAALVRSGVLPV